IDLTAKVDVLVCQEQCIPESSTHQVALNSGQNTAPNDLSAAIARLPQDSARAVFFGEDKGNLFISTEVLSGESFSDAELASMHYLPEDWGFVSNPAPVRTKIENNYLILSQQRGDRDIADIST